MIRKWGRDIDAMGEGGDGVDRLHSVRLPPMADARRQVCPPYSSLNATEKDMLAALRKCDELVLDTTHWNNV